MIRSMTGFGKAEITIRKKKVTVEASSLNSRYMETSIRLPKTFSDYEAKVREAVRSLVGRGKVLIVVTVDGGAVTPDDLILNEDAAKLYFKMFTDLKKKFSLKGEINLNHFTALPDLFGVAVASQASNSEAARLVTGVKRAISQMNKMRHAEGKELARDMQKRLTRINASVAKVIKLRPQTLSHYRKRLQARIEDLLSNSGKGIGDSESSKLRLEMEVALLADKSDVTEECVRLSSHTKAFAAAMRASGEAGKKLNFILQEMNREANTIGSKSTIYDISCEVISIREEVEKLREQVQNIE